MLTYSSYVNELSNLLPTEFENSKFFAMVTNVIDAAEQRIYRELDLLNTVTRDVSTAFTTGTRTFQLPAANGTFYVVNELYAITPAGQSNADLGTRNFLTPVSRPFLDALFPSSLGSSVPQYFAMTTQTSIIVGPWPDQAYQVEVMGTVRPVPLSAANVTSMLSVYFPDLFIAASMVFVSGFMQNLGMQTVPPATEQSWEAYYQSLVKSAQVEEARKKFTAEGWSSKSPSQIVTPPRT